MNRAGNGGAPATPPGFVPAVPGGHGQGARESDRATEIAGVSGMRPPVQVSLTPGMLLGDRYRLTRLIGSGGMGQAWEAEHIVIRKKVAIKVLGGSSMGPDPQESAERLLREAQAAAQIKHPNIVDITDFGHTRDRQPFYVMELLEGSTLKELIQTDGAMPWPRAQAMLLQMCEALAKAHAHGVIHRDLKPDNIFIVSNGPRRDFVKIIDFGIAKLTTLDPQAKAFTRTGMVYGTPQFMSPEQSEGEKIDARTDVYALGCVAYQMLTGSLPFAGETPTEVIYKQLFEEPTSMGEAAPHNVVGGDVEAVVLKAMRKSRDLRFQSMHEMGEAVRVAGTGAAAVAVPVETIRKPPRGYQPSFAGASAMAPDRATPVPMHVPAQGGNSVGVGLAIACFGGLVMLGLLAYLALTRLGGGAAAPDEAADETPTAAEAVEEGTEAAPSPEVAPTETAPAESPEGEADTAAPTEAAAPTPTAGGRKVGGKASRTPTPEPEAGLPEPPAPGDPAPLPEATPDPVPEPVADPTPEPTPPPPEPKPEPPKPDPPKKNEPEGGVHDSDLVNPWDK